MTTSVSPRQLTVVSVVIAAVVVLLDQLTKSWAVHSLADGHTVELIGSLRLNLTYNSGMAFSRGKGAGQFIAVIALAVIVVLLASLRRTGSVLSSVGLGLVIGGAIGNVADRLFRAGDGFLGGEVVDFIDLQWWPVFNVADMAITVGGAILIVGSDLRRSPHEGRGVNDPAGGGDDIVREEIPAALAGERLDRVVSLLTGCSRSESAALIAAGAVTVDGVVVTTGKQRVVTGQVVTAAPADRLGDAPPEPDPAVVFGVVYEDDDVIVVDKPSGLVVHPGAGQPGGTLVNGLLARYPELADVGEVHRPGLVHRLDRDTSGLLVVARTTAGLRRPRRRPVGPGGHPPVPGPRLGGAGGGAGRHRGADRPISPRAHPHGRRLDRPGGPHPIRGGGRVLRAGRVLGAALPARDRPDAPDPGPSRRRSGIPSSATGTTAGCAPGSRCPGWSCTPSTSPSSTPSPARRWRSTHPCPTTWPVCCPASGADRPQTGSWSGSGHGASPRAWPATSASV